MALQLQYDKQGRIYSPLRKKHLVATPEEKVRQALNLARLKKNMKAFLI